MFVNFRIMKGSMSNFIHHLKIFNSIIVSTKVDVMYNFIRHKLSTKMLLNNISMLWNKFAVLVGNVGIFSSSLNSTFPISIRRSTIFSFKSDTEFLALLRRNYVSCQRLGDFLTNFWRTRNASIPRRFAFPSTIFRHSFFRFFRISVFMPTVWRAKFPTTNLNFPRSCKKRFATMYTGSFNHRNIIPQILNQASTYLGAMEL